MMVDKVEAPDPSTVVFRLKFATSAFLPALADPFTLIYKKAILDKDPHWYEKNILGSGPFKFVDYETGQSIKGERNPDYYHKGLPYLDGFTGIYADKQAMRVEAIRADRAAIEFRSMPPSARDELVKALGDKITVQESDWNCASAVTPNHKRKPFDDPRVRRALTLAIDRWHGAPALSKIAIVKTVGGIVFPGSPLARDQGGAAADRRLLARYREIAGRGEAAVEGGRGRGADLRAAQPQCRPALQIRRDLAGRRVEQDRREGDAAGRAERPVVRGDAQRRFRRRARRPGHSMVNPLLDVQKELPRSVASENYGNYDDPQEIDIYEKMLHETDPARQRALMRQFEKYVLGRPSAYDLVLWWHRIVPYRSYVKGWKISPRHFINQDLARSGSINDGRKPESIVCKERRIEDRRVRSGQVLDGMRPHPEGTGCCGGR